MPASLAVQDRLLLERATFISCSRTGLRLLVMDENVIDQYASLYLQCASHKSSPGGDTWARLYDAVFDDSLGFVK